MQSIIGEALPYAIGTLRSCISPYGLYASGGKKGYTQVWSRDSNVAMIGASLHTKEFRNVFAKSLNTLARKQSANGQIPNAVDFIGSIDKPATFATIDSSLWFILGENFYKKKFGSALWNAHRKSTDAALKWVRFQDAGEDMLPEQLPTSDWMDCFPHKYGHTINTQALYYGAMNAMGKRQKLKEYKKWVDYYLWSDKPGHYLPWHWKDHGPKYKEKEEWFDSLGNVLAIVFGLADRKQANSILDFIGEKGINRPYPLRAIYPPIGSGSAEWRDYFSASLAGEKHSYLNGGIWPFIGGFYVCALVQAKRLDEAEAQLERLARANRLGTKGMDWDFNEWVHPVSGKASGGRHQAWSAGAFLMAYECVKRGKNLLLI